MSHSLKTGSTPRIVVIGSINCDFTTFVEDFPVKNQTVMARQFSFNVGGKGLNQAVAAARFGADVSFVGCVGNDDFGRNAIEYMNGHGIDTSHVQVMENDSTGSAGIFVNSGGENMIAVTPGANAQLAPALIDGAANLIADSAVLLLQLEIPCESVGYALSMAKSHSVLSILNPAPMLPTARDIIAQADIVTPNETEMAELFNDEDPSPAAPALEQVKNKAHKLVSAGVNSVITTLGAEGCLVYSANLAEHIPSHQVNVVDATGAGDVFNGVLASCVADGQPMQESSRLAVAAAAMSVEKETVCDAAPSRKEVHEFLSERN